MGAFVVSRNAKPQDAGPGTVSPEKDTHEAVCITKTGNAGKQRSGGRKKQKNGNRKGEKKKNRARIGHTRISVLKCRLQ